MLLIFALIYTTPTDSHLYSENIDDYQACTEWSEIFLDTIPEYATVDEFSYTYDELYVEEIYLELSFNSGDDTIQYVNEVYSYSVDNFSSYDKPTVGAYFKIVTNPYNSDYTDMFCLGDAYIYYSEAEFDDYLPYTGYEIYSSENSEGIYYCFGVISYSETDRKVIQSYCFVCYTSYMPKYVSYFDPEIKDGLIRKLPVTKNSDIA